jgi:hypothetical protein
MPLVLEAGRILSDARFKPDVVNFTAHLFSWSGVEMLKFCLIVLVPVGMLAVMGLVPFYVSTMARNTLQCLAPAVLGLLLAWTLILNAAGQWNQTYHFLWSGALGCFIVLPIVAVTVLALAFRNFRSVLTGWRMAAGNLLTLVAALALGVVLTSATYHRFWEKFTSFEPRHGAARLSLSNPASLTADWAVAVHLPDGKIWMASYLPVAASPLNLMLGNFKMALDSGEYAPGTNWSSFERGYWLTVGLKNDGTLWASTNLPPDIQPPTDRWKVSEVPINSLVQFGSETNWTSFVPSGGSLLLVKNDGTLWRMNVLHFDSQHKPQPLEFTPHRLGSESNWAGVFQNGHHVWFRKTDGSAWIIEDNWSTNAAHIEIEPGLVVHAVPAFDQNKMRSTTVISHGLPFGVGIRSDGTFRIWADEQLRREGKRNFGNYEWLPADLQIGADTNWLAVAGGGAKAITLKNDGTLWVWDYDPDQIRGWEQNPYEREVLDTVPVRLGTHSDWIAISGGNDGVTALAADGSLWYWPLVDASHFADMARASSIFGEISGTPVLDISRKPQFLGNVFDAKD